jgi:hypothetical protein
MSKIRVGRVPGFEGWWTTPRGITTNDPAGDVIVRPYPHGQFPLDDVESLLMVAVEVGPGTRRSWRDNVIVDRIRATGILVADLGYHLSADRIREGYAVVWADEETPILGAHVHVPSRSYLGRRTSVLARSRPHGCLRRAPAFLVAGFGAQHAQGFAGEVHRHRRSAVEG